jgi:hypothetical protein
VASPRVAPRSVLWKCQIPSVRRKQVIPPERRNGGCARPGVGPRAFWKRKTVARSLSSPALALQNVQRRRVDPERGDGPPSFRGTGPLPQGSWLDPPGPGEAETVRDHQSRRLPRGSQSTLVVMRHSVCWKATHLARGMGAQSGHLPGVPSLGTRKGGRAHGTPARFRPPKAFSPNRALCVIGKGCTRPRGKPSEAARQLDSRSGAASRRPARPSRRPRGSPRKRDR